MSIVKVRAALETALNAMAGIIPSVVITSSAIGGVFTTATPHGLTTGLNVLISGHTGSTPAVSGNYLVVVTGLSTFTLQNTATKATIALSAGGTGGLVRANLIAWENMYFQSVGDVPYEQVHHVRGRPDNPTFGAPFHRERGYMQVNLFYPLHQGSAAIMNRAELIRSTFSRSSSFTVDEVTVIIEQTPTIGDAAPDPSNDRFMVPVKIFYYANIFS